jgi:hypothetical protein
MANVFKNYTSSSVGTTETTVYTVPADTTAILLGANLANETGSSIDVTVKLAGTIIVKDAPVPPGSALGVIDGKIIAEAGEAITVQSSADTSLGVILSVMEQS